MPGYRPARKRTDVERTWQRRSLFICFYIALYSARVPTTAGTRAASEMSFACGGRSGCCTQQTNVQQRHTLNGRFYNSSSHTCTAHTTTNGQPGGPGDIFLGATPPDPHILALRARHAPPPALRIDPPFKMARCCPQCRYKALCAAAPIPCSICQLSHLLWLIL